VCQIAGMQAHTGRMEVRSRKSNAASRLGVVALTCSSLLGIALADPDSATANPSTGTMRTLGCTDSYGVGDGAVSSNFLSLGGVAFNGLSRSGSEPLTYLPNRLLWYKVFIDIPKTPHRNILVSVRPLTTGRVGMNWGTQSVSGRSTYSAKKSLRVDTLHIHVCGGSAGFPGGFVMTQPLCARVNVTEGRTQLHHEVDFGLPMCNT
jgi:hypothetical protein